MGVVKMTLSFFFYFEIEHNLSEIFDIQNFKRASIPQRESYRDHM